MNYKTYGKQPYLKSFYNEIRYRFQKNQHTEALLKSKGLESYIPKLNKVRFGSALILSAIWIILPLLTILSIPTMRWGLK